jgi:hypothetical protein
MTQSQNNKWITIGMAALLLAGFFLPWVKWMDTTVSGCSLPSGNFFSISETKFGLTDPFPQFSFLTLIFSLNPLSAFAIILLLLFKKKTGILPALAGVLALCQVTIYILFTQTIIDQVGVVKSLLPALQIGLYATVIGGAGIILAGVRRKIGLKAALIFAGPILTWLGFTLLSGYLMKDHDDTAKIKSDYTVNALDMIREFEQNDSAANAKYKEKILTVNGRISETELLNDSTVNIKMADTTGSYAIFSFSGNDAIIAKGMNQGDSISVKGSCSGGEYSNILEVHYISFKRSVLNK